MNFQNKECLLKFIGFLFLVAQCLSMVEGEVHYYEFVLAEKNFTKLCNTTSKHGVKQPRNPWSDGPEYITQCPIEPGSNFTYEVIFSTEEGTLWWHAHSDWTRAYVHGAIVILPTIGTTYPFTKPDDEDIIILGSLYRGNLKSELDYALIYGDDLPHSIGYTINGEPGDLCPCSKVVAANMFFAIAEHNLTIVGIDASYIKPITTSYIMIAAGQTMDILLTANQTLGHYYIAARQFWSQEVDLTNFDESNVTAIIEYRGNYTIPSSPSFPSTLPNYKDSRAAIKFSSLLRSLASKDHPVNVPLNITTRMYITVSMAEIECINTTCTTSGEDITLATSVNNISWNNPVPTDVLLAYYRLHCFYKEQTNQTLGHYYIAARQFWSQEVDLTNFDESNVTAIIEYRGNYTIPSSPSFPSTLPNYKDSRAAIKFSSLLRSLASKDHPVNVPLNITTRMYITVSMAEIECINTTCTTSGEDITLATSVNNISWNNPVPTDVLLAYYSF
ncbi:laccase-14 [Quercus suber]|uniref:Laccase-14 n=1 Tax=Quercus suber TaxID=58331 RepID=A0AAW0KS87_QUESU